MALYSGKSDGSSFVKNEICSLREKFLHTFSPPHDLCFCFRKVTKTAGRPVPIPISKRCGRLVGFQTPFDDLTGTLFEAH